jgi:hypothetical protein
LSDNHEHDYEHAHAHEPVHNHNHEHAHGHDNGHDLAHNHNHAHNHEPVLGQIVVETKLHDDAVVTSGKIRLITADSERLRVALQSQMQLLAQQITDDDGIIGHIKAVYQVATTDMLSITLDHVTTKYASEQTVDINLVTIAFFVDQKSVSTLVSNALEAVKTA